MAAPVRQVFEFVTKTRGSARDIKDELDGVADSTGRVGDESDKSEPSVGRFGGALSKLGGIAKVAGAALGGMAIGATVGAAVSVVKDFTEMESAMNRVEAQTGLSGAALAEFKTQAQSIYKAGLGESLTDVAETMTQVQQVTQASGNELYMLSTKTQQFSEIFGTDIGESIRATDTAMEAFGINGQKAYDLLTAGMQQTGDPADDLLDTFNEYSNNFADMGFTAEQMLSFMNQGLQNGARNTDDIADGMREFNIKLKEGASDTALWQLGLDGMNQKYKAGEIDAANMFESVIQGLNDIEDPIERNALGVEIFGTKWEDAGEQAFLALDPTSIALENVDGSLNKASNSLQRGLGPAWTRFQRTIRTGMVNAFGPLVSKGLNAMTEGLVKVGDWVMTVGMPIMRQFGGTLLSLGKDAMAAGKAIVERLVGAFNSIKDAFSGGGISGGLSELFSQLFSMSGDITGTLINKIYQPIVDFVTNLDWSGIGSKLKEIFDAILGGAEDVFDWIKEKIWDPLQSGLGDSTETQNVATKAGEIAGKILSGMADALGDVVGWVKTNVIDKIVGALTGGSGDSRSGGGVSSASEGIGYKILSGIASAFVEVYSWIANNVILPFARGLTGAGSNEELLAKALLIGEDILSGIASAFTSISSWVVTEIILPLALAIGSGDWIDFLLGAAKTIGSKVLEGAAGAFATMGTWLFTKIITPLALAIISGEWIEFLLGAAKTIGEKILEGIGNVFLDIIEWFITDVITPLADTIASADYAAMLDAALDIGKKLLDKIVEGIKNSPGALVDAIKGLLPDAGFLGDAKDAVLGWAGLASGGIASAGTPYIVGEEGPELFIPGHTGTVVPNHALMAQASGASGGGGKTININGDITITGVQDLRGLYESLVREGEKRA